jgi:aerobic-type carbon monoxide dehydrogenase small subunit (CoxS/CutS family)
MAEQSISLIVNGVHAEGHVEPRKLLADFLREDLGLTATHVSCAQGVCGVCTVLVDGQVTRSCLMLAVQAAGTQIMTVEGLAKGGTWHPIQAAFREFHALQCGFCTPGFLMTIYALLRDRPDPRAAEVRDALEGVVCRCTGYHNIVLAVEGAAKQLRS